MFVIFSSHLLRLYCNGFKLCYVGVIWPTFFMFFFLSFSVLYLFRGGSTRGHRGHVPPWWLEGAPPDRGLKELFPFDEAATCPGTARHGAPDDSVPPRSKFSVSPSVYWMDIVTCQGAAVSSFSALGSWSPAHQYPVERVIANDERSWISMTLKQHFKETLWPAGC